MFQFFLKRTFESLATLIAVASATFFLLHSLPGGPFDDEISLSPEVRAIFDTQYGLSDSVGLQYVRYLSNVARGNLGFSYQFPDESVISIVADSVPVSVRLGALALFLSLLFGVVIGILATFFDRTWIGFLLMWLAGSGIALPSFLVAPVFILIFSVYLGWLPPALWEGPEYWVLPVFVLLIRPVSIIARLVRVSALDVVSKDYTVAIRARGASEFRIFFIHVLKNSLLPVLGVLGQIAAGVLSGSFVVEMIFAIPGAGRHLIEGVLARDYPLVMAMVILYTLILTLAHLFIDLSIYWVDPRVNDHETV